MDRVLVVGGNGMLGRAVAAVARASGRQCANASRTGADFGFDLRKPESWNEAFDAFRPKLVVNCAAIASIEQCARAPDLADLVNGQAPGTLALRARQAGAAFVQISTDHFFTGDGRDAHSEDRPIVLLNTYARSKRRGEIAALACEGALVLRTNVTGWRGEAERPTFVEWAHAALASRRPGKLFIDYFTSTIDAPSFAQAMFDLVERGAQGLLNLASRDVSSKYEFVRALARQMDLDAEHMSPGSVGELAERRADSCGLDVSRAEAMLGRRLPGLDDVAAALRDQME